MDDPQTLGEHLKKRRRELGLLQRQVEDRMGIDLWTYINWEKDKTRPVAARFRLVATFLGCDPTPTPSSLRNVWRQREGRQASPTTRSRPSWLGSSLAYPSRALEAFLHIGEHELAQILSPGWYLGLRKAGRFCLDHKRVTSPANRAAVARNPQRPVDAHEVQ